MVANVKKVIQLSFVNALKVLPVKIAEKVSLLVFLNKF